MKKTNKAQVGDVIMSPDFAKSNTDSSGRIYVGYGQDNSPQRAKSKYVVETAKMAGGGTGHGPGDIYPDGWQIIARKLRRDGTYNPAGELIEFYQSGAFNCLIQEVEVVCRLKKVVNFVFV